MNAAQIFFASVAAEEPPLPPRIGAIDINDRIICRWCLRKFDPQQQKPRTIAERGALRTRLAMADNGSELVICDNCWPGAMGGPTFLHGQAVICADPNIVPNALLRQTQN